MKSTVKKSEAALLRQKAEKQLKKKAPKTVSKLSEVEMLKLVHELEVHQIELEITLQTKNEEYAAINEELRSSIEELQAAEEELRVQNEELQQTEESLRESEAKYRLQFQNMNSYNSLYEVVTNMEGKPYDFRFLIVNQAYEEYVGKKASELIGKTLLEVYPETEQYWIDKMGEAALTGLPIHFENYSTVMNTHTEINLFTPQKGQLAMTTANISERKKAEETLRASEERYRLLANNVPDIIYSLNGEGNIVAVNSSAFRRYGYTEEDVNGKPFLGFVHPEDREIVIKSFLNAREQQRKFTHGLQFRIVAENGFNFWFELNSQASFDRHGLYTGEDGVLRDITERKQAEAKLRKSEEHIKIIFQTLTEGVALNEMVFNNIGEMIDYTIIEVNEAFYKTADFRKDEIVVGNMASKLYGMDHEVIKDFWKNHKHVTSTIVTEYISPISKRTFSISTSPFINNRFVTSFQEITERKQVENSLKQSEEKFRNLFNNAEVGMYRTRLDGSEIVDFNERYLKIINYTYEEIKGSPSINLWADKQERETMVQMLKADGIVTDFECGIVNKQGEVRRCITSLRLYRDEEIIEGSIQDITDRKKAEEQIREKDIQFRKLSANLPDLIFQFTKRPDGTYCVPIASAGIKNIFGCSPEDVVDDFTPIGKVIYPDDAERVINEIEYSAKNMTHFTCEFRVQIPGKPIQWIFSRSNPEKLRDGSITWYGFNADITERKRVEEILKFSEEKYRSLVETAQELVWKCDGNGCFTYLNPAWEKTHGYKVEEMLGKNFGSFQKPEIFERDIKEFSRHLAGGSVKEYETTQIAKDGRDLTLLFNAIPLFNIDGIVVGTQGTAIDITDRKRAEEELRESEDKYRGVVENSPNAIAIYVEGKIVFVNNQCVVLMAAANKEELIGKPVIQFVHPDNRAMVIARMQQVAIDGKPLPTAEEKFIRMDGTSIDVEVRAVPTIYQQKPAVHLIVQDITERKQAEEKLRENEERLSSLFANMTEGFSIQDVICDDSGKPCDLRFVDANPAFERQTGLKNSETLGHTLRELFPTSEQSWIDRYGKVGLTGESISFEAMFGPLNIYYHVNAFQTKPGQFGVMFTDVNERKKAEIQLHLITERLNLATISAKAGVWDWNLQTNEMIWDDRMRELYGLSLENFSGGIDAWEKGLHPKDASRAVDECQQAIRGEREFDTAFRVIHPNGEVIHIKANGLVIRDENGKPVRMIGLNTDITERKKAEEALVFANERLALAQQSAGAGVWDWDIPTGKLNWSPELFHLFGLDPAKNEATFDVWNSVIHPDDIKIAGERINEAIRDQKQLVNEYRIIKPSGDILWINAIGDTLYNERGDAFRMSGICIDITERKNSEQALRQAQKLESIGTLAGGIAHDFNNLMNAVLGQSSLALGKLPKESPAVNNIQKAIKASERVADLTKQLLAYSGRGRFVIDEIDLNKLVKENIAILEVSIPKTTQLHYELGNPSPHVMGDISQIQQVIMNLIINAGEAMGSNPGTITVHTNRIELQENNSEYSKYSVTPIAAGSYALLQVKDNGSGISEETLTRIFDPFFTTKFTGRGLGLAAVLGIIKGHKGGLRIESEVGKGTMFEIVWPLVEPSQKSNITEKKEIVVNGEGKTILVIDDESTVIELLDDVLNEANFKVISALDPLKGIELYRQHHQNISLVILDYSMPHMDGKAAFEKLIKINKNVKVLLCSGYSEEETLSVFGIDRPTGFFHKPYDTDAIAQQVAEIISKES